MNNVQLFLSIGIPSFLVLVGILTNQLGLNRLENRLETRLIVIEADLRRFYELIGEHSGKIDMLQKKG